MHIKVHKRISATKLSNYHSYLVTRAYFTSLLPNYQITTVTWLSEHISHLCSHITKLPQLPGYQNIFHVFAPKLPNYHIYLVTRAYFTCLLPNYQITTVTWLPGHIFHLGSQITKLPQLPGYQGICHISALKLPSYHSYQVTRAYLKSCNKITKLPYYHSYLVT